MRLHTCAVVSILMLLCSMPLAAQENSEANAIALELSKNISGTGGKWVKLLRAIPDDQLDWRPQEGVRSVRELFTHIADANFYFLTFVGHAIPEDVVMPEEQETRENRFRSKADLLAYVERSFKVSVQYIRSLTAEQLDATVNMWGSKTTGRNAMIADLGHMHEHLGQAIAYARFNDIVPPWSQGE